MEPHGQEPVAPMVRRNLPKLQASFAKASEDTRIPPRSRDRGFLRRQVIRLCPSPPFREGDGLSKLLQQVSDAVP